MSPRRFIAALVYLACAIAAATLIALAVAALGLHVAEPAGITIGVFLAISGALTLLIGGSLLWLVASPTQLGLRPRLIIALAAGSGIALLNVLVTAWLMFISPHDLGLLLLLLIFSLLVSLAFAAVLSRAVMSCIAQVVAGTRRLADGDFAVRVDVVGHGELADLARDFNRMAERVQSAFEHERELDAARRSLVASVSHDLRSPLASIRAAVEALNDGIVSEPEVVQRYLHSVLQDVTRLSRLIDDLFELARLDAGSVTLSLEETSLSDLISDTLESMRLRAEQRGIRLDGAVEGEPVVRADAAKIQRVLDNLMENALRYTPSGGSIQLVARETPDAAYVEVRDTGDGIAPSDLPHVFDRFYRGDPARQRTGGAGLGLAIARGFIEAHGGTIAVASRPSQGAVFTCRLPRSRAAHG